MPTLYNKIQGQSLERLAALSDGIFAVAMTLLVLDLRVPIKDAVHSEGQLQAALAALAPQFISYLMSCLTLGIFWAGQQTQLNHFARGNRDLTWIHIAFLFAVSVLPFSTRLLAEFIGYRTALLLCWANVFALGAILYASWRYATRAGLLKDDVSLEIRRAIRRRIVFAQGLYALARRFASSTITGVLVLSYWCSSIMRLRRDYGCASKSESFDQLKGSSSD